MTVNVKYKVHKTPNNDEKRKALIFLGIDIGNITKKAKTQQSACNVTFHEETHQHMEPTNGRSCLIF